MSYRAEVNGNIFLDTSISDDAYTLTSAIVQFVKGEAGTFSFTVPSCNAEYNSFEKITSYVDLYRDDELIFFGRVYSIKQTFDNSLEIVCEGMMSVLADTIFTPVTFDDTVHALIHALIDSHNAQVEARKQITVGVLYVSDAPCYRAYQNYETTWSRLRDLADSYGGFFKLRKTNNVYYLDWYDHCTDGSSQSVDFGENILDLTKYHDANSVATVLTPLGAADDNNVRINIASVNQGSTELYASQEYINQYGYVHKTHIWDDVNVPSILAAKGLQYLNACLLPQYTINVTAVDMADAGYNIDHFAVGQRLKITSVPNGINGLWFDVNTQVLNLFYPQDNQLSVGTELIKYAQVRRADVTSIRNAVEKIAALYTPRSALDDAINQATSLITGNSGGYIILHDSDNDGEPDELLVMDTPDINTAVKIWRFNNAGLGYSSTGYDGVYGLAMTMDGAIVADRITTGTLNGNLLKAGVIRGQNGNSYWDLNTGVLHIEGSGDIDKSKTFIYEPVPPYYVGDLWCTQRSETSGVVGYAIAGYAVAGDESSGEGGKIMACIYTRTSGEFDARDWTLITNYIDDADLQVLERRVSTAELNINANAAEIQLRATTEVVDGIGNRLASAETAITQNSHDIELKVSESDVTGNYLISKINLNSTTATIAASHIDLQGAVTISSLDSTTKGSIVIGNTSKMQYYLSTSASSATGGSWSDTVPTWSSGTYVWTRIASVKTYADNTTSTSYSTAVYDTNLTTACRKSNSADATIADWCYNNNITYIDGGHIYTGTIDAAKIAAGAITVGKIADGAVSTAKLADSSVTTAKIPSYAITGVKIADNAIEARCIVANAITANKIAAGAITADKISVSDLSALGATIGGFTIDSTSIHTKDLPITSTQSRSLGISSAMEGFTREINSTSRSYLMLAIGNMFAVDRTGVLYSGSAYMSTVNTGTITSTSNCVIGAWNIYRGTSGGTAYGASIGSGTSTSSVTLKNPDSSNQAFLQASANNATNFTATTAGAVTVSGVVTCQRCSETSDREVKTDIRALNAEESEKFIYGLNPVRFRNISNVDAVHHGFVAQDVEELVHDWDVVTNYDAESNGETVRRKALSYTEIIADLVKTVQRQNERIKALEG